MLEVDGSVIAPSELISRVESLAQASDTTPPTETHDVTWTKREASSAHAAALATLGQQLVLPDVTSSSGLTSPVRRLVKKVVRKLTWWYVEPRWRVQRDVDTHLAHFAAAVVAELDRLGRELDHLQRRQTQLALQAAQFVDRLGTVRDGLEASAARHESLARRLEHVEGLESVVATRDHVGALRSELSALMARLGMASVHGADIDYVAFEERFRGSSADLVETQRVYVGHFAPASAGGVVIDLGCGRGEMLEALVAAGHTARGVDRDPGMVAACRRKGLDVVEDDLLAFMEKLEPSSIAGFFCAQVVEHLLTAEIERMVQLAADKLNSGGVFVIETINPRSLHAFANHFLADTSHVRPVHPETLRFICEQHGFANVALVEKARHAMADVPDDVPDGGVRDALEHLLNSVYGYQDYAIVATR